jgi:hypothetical protein
MTQPEALRLADELDWRYEVSPVLPQAAAELRRLHQSEREGWRYADELEQERKRLNAVNAQLVEALHNLLYDTQHAEHDCGDEKWCPVIAARAALAALAAAKEQA